MSQADRTRHGWHARQNSSSAGLPDWLCRGESPWKAAPSTAAASAPAAEDPGLSRVRDDTPTFQSVILAGVTDVKNLTSKIREEDQQRVYSPWNIAADFDIDMSLSEAGIRGMLEEYEADHRTGMDTAEMARLLREYTNGDPVYARRVKVCISTRHRAIITCNSKPAGQKGSIS